MHKKPFELERDSKWRDLREKVYYQAYGVEVKHKVDGSLRDAMQAVRRVADKYEFKVHVFRIRNTGMIGVKKERR